MFIYSVTQLQFLPLKHAADKRNTSLGRTGIKPSLDLTSDGCGARSLSLLVLLSFSCNGSCFLSQAVLPRDSYFVTKVAISFPLPTSSGIRLPRLVCPPIVPKGMGWDADSSGFLPQRKGIDAMGNISYMLDTCLHGSGFAAQLCQFLSRT